MFPINFIEHFSFAFGQAVLELARNQGVSVLGIKATSDGDWPESVPRKDRYWWYKVLNEKPHLSRAVRFSLSQKNVAAVIPASYLDNYKATVAIALDYKPITSEEEKQLHNLAKKPAPCLGQALGQFPSSQSKHHRTPSRTSIQCSLYYSVRHMSTSGV